MFQIMASRESIQQRGLLLLLYVEVGFIVPAPYVPMRYTPGHSHPLMTTFPAGVQSL